MKKQFIILVVFFALALCFIWGNSILSVEVSAKISTFISSMLADFVEPGIDSGASYEFGLRKIAHFFEFCVLGVISSLLLRICIPDSHISLPTLAFLGMFIAVIDETIQIFSGRHPAIRDVWIDIGGYVLGCIIVWAYLCLKSYLAKKRKKLP